MFDGEITTFSALLPHLGSSCCMSSANSWNELVDPAMELKITRKM
jgi:hypothetical protein